MLISFEDITANYKIIEQNKTNNRLPYSASKKKSELK